MNVKENRKKKLVYGVVGVWNTVFAYVAFYLIYEAINKHIHYFAILLLSQVVGLTNAFVLHKWLVFKSKGPWLKEYVKYYFVYGGTLIFNLIAIWLMVDIGGLNVLIAQLIISIVVVVMAYIGHNNFSFASKK